MSESKPLTIDRRSYDLGIIFAFGEMVHVGLKKLALSAPMAPEEMDGLMDEAQRIAQLNQVELYRETDFLVTDLFPAEVTAGKHVFLIYQGLTKQEYLDLKAEKARLVQAGQYHGAARREIARRFGRLLSYPDETIDSMLEARLSIQGTIE